MGYGSPHLVRPACPFTARACGPFLFRRFAPLAASVAASPLPARPPVAVITARATPPKPAASPPRPACGPVLPFPSLCPPKPATARLAASIARPPSAPFPSAVAAPPLCPLDGPPRPAAVRPLVTARPGAPKPATGRGSPPAVRLAARPPGSPPPCPPPGLPPGAARPPVRPSGLPGDHRPPPRAVRPPPQGAPPPVKPGCKNPVKIRNLTRRPRIKPDCKKSVKNRYCKFFAIRKIEVFCDFSGIFITRGGEGGTGADFFYILKNFLKPSSTSAFLRRLADHNLRKFPSRNIGRQTWRFSVKSSRTVMSVITA